MPLGSARFGLQSSAPALEVSYLVVAGGGGGGADQGAGGGAGGYRNSFASETSDRDWETKTS